MEGYHYAAYMRYLEDKLEEFQLLKAKSNKRTKKTPTSEISIKQQLLILSYLGVLDEVRKGQNATKEAKFVGLLINKSAQNIRQAFSNFTSLNENEEDLEAVLDLFEELGMKKEIKKVKADLEELQ